MAETLTLISERVDDIPLLLAQLDKVTSSKKRFAQLDALREADDTILARYQV
jgi:hypothetical protein